jgi:hypothetical protein
VKDYSDGKHKKYGIIEYEGAYAVVEARERDELDDSEIVMIKPGTISISKSIPTLQKQIREMIERESTPMVSGLEKWKEAKTKQRKLKEKIGAK